MLVIGRFKTYIKIMEGLEPWTGFYAEKQYGEYEKKFLHHATVSMLNIHKWSN